MERFWVVEVVRGRRGSFGIFLVLFAGHGACGIVSVHRADVSPESWGYARRNYSLRLRPLNTGGGFGCRLAGHGCQTIEQWRDIVAHLLSCTASQSVVHRVLLTEASAITCLNSA